MNRTENLVRHGYLMLPGIFSAGQVSQFSERLQRELEQQRDTAVLKSRNRIYGSRSLLASCPWLAETLLHPSLLELLKTTLGDGAGLVRGLFFDKPPDRSWSLPWHRDRTIAVKDNRLPTSVFKSPTRKAGIPHLEAPDELLARMLTLRIHLDAMTAENGPLSVIPGSHLLDPAQEEPPLTLSCAAGDVLAMRPLLSHSSSMSKEGTTAHRRVVHLEFAADATLPDGIEWHDFQAIG